MEGDAFQVGSIFRNKENKPLMFLTALQIGWNRLE
jgi:hypothetical protein